MDLIQTYIVNLKDFWILYLVLLFITWLIVRFLNWITTKLFCRSKSKAMTKTQQVLTSVEKLNVPQKSEVDSSPQTPAGDDYLNLTKPIKKKGTW